MKSFSSEYKFNCTSMDKRAYALIASPNKVQSLENCKKLKISSISPKKMIVDNEEELHNELDGLCFDDDEDDDFGLQVWQEIE